MVFTAETANIAQPREYIWACSDPSSVEQSLSHPEMAQAGFCEARRFPSTQTLECG